MQINWDDLPPEAQYVAQDWIGHWHWFENEPVLREDLVVWRSTSGEFHRIYDMDERFYCDYKRSLKKRPKNKYDNGPTVKITAVPRYSLGIQYIKTGASEGYGAPAIIESEDGEYVKLDDYIELLNAFNQYVSRTHKEIA